MKRSSVVLVVIAVTLLAVVLPVSWQAMHKELGQSRNMKALRATIEQIDDLSHQCEPARLQHLAAGLLESTLEIDLAFSYLAQASPDFANSSASMREQATRFRTRSLQEGCSARSQLSVVKETCKQCHAKFR